MPKPEPKPVVTLADWCGHAACGRDLLLNGNVIGELHADERGPFVVELGDLYADELRAIADWLDQWQDTKENDDA